MAGILEDMTWKPLNYLSSEELVRLDERLEYALQDVSCLVFWTGMDREQAEHWARRHKLPTLSIAMGPLFSERDRSGARFGKSSKSWSKYMSGASCRFAESACHGGRRVVVLTRPPPDIYSSRQGSKYRNLEEPILKGAAGGPGTLQIDYVHPMVANADDFQYQAWPIDKSSDWVTFVRTLLLQRPITAGIRVTSAIVVAGQTDGHRVVAMQRKYDEFVSVGQGKRLENGTKCVSQTLESSAKGRERRTEDNCSTELEGQEARENEAKRKRVDLEQKAREKKEAKRKRVKLEQQKARERREAKRKRAELEQQQKACEIKEANRKRVQLEQQKARERKEAKRKRVELEQQQAREKKEAKRKRAELEQQQKAREKKEAKRKRLELEQQKAREKKEAGRKQAKFEQQKAEENKQGRNEASGAGAAENS